MPPTYMKVENMFNVIKEVITGLQEKGMRVICVLTENNTINKKEVLLYSCPPKLSVAYPVHRSRPLFLFDFFYQLKCVSGISDFIKTLIINLSFHSSLLMEIMIQ